MSADSGADGATPDLGADGAAPRTGAEGVPPEPGAPPGWVRAAVWTFLAVFAICGFARIEAWPFTAWQLFSHARTQVQHGWTATISPHERASGEVPLAQVLDAGYYGSGNTAYRGLPQLVQRFHRYDAARRDAICHAWRDRAWRNDLLGPIRIYATVVDVGRREAGAPATTRTLRFVCDRDGVTEVPA